MALCKTAVLSTMIRLDDSARCKTGSVPSGIARRGHRADAQLGAPVAAGAAEATGEVDGDGGLAVGDGEGLEVEGLALAAEAVPAGRGDLVAALQEIADRGRGHLSHQIVSHPKMMGRCVMLRAGLATASRCSPGLLRRFGNHAPRSGDSNPYRPFARQADGIEPFPHAAAARA